MSAYPHDYMYTSLINVDTSIYYIHEYNLTSIKWIVHSALLGNWKLRTYDLEDVYSIAS